MFKKTRRKIIAAIMSVPVFLFIGMLILIYSASYYETTKENEMMLKAHTQFFSLKNMEDASIPDGQLPDIGDLIQGEPQSDNVSGRNFRDMPQYRLSAFYSVVFADDGSILVAENPNEVYEDEKLIKIAKKVYRLSKDSGRVGSLLFNKADKGGYTLVAFMDNSVMQNSMTTLFKYMLLCGSIAIVLFFFLSRHLARMIVRPLEESYTKQKQFISDAGHELKTPVSVVNANAELLSREIGENQWLANIQYENERMGSLVTQLLDLARTENATPQMETVDLSRLVSGEALPFESVVFEKGMTLSCDIQKGLEVSGNPTQLKQLTAILLDNAVRHATEKSEILLRLKSERGHAILSVMNDGDEIPPEQRKNIFERFYRVDTARNDEDKHYGLGLAIARSISAAHHGKIGVRCYNQKVEFTVRIPMN